MTEPLEIELKLDVAPDRLAQLEASPLLAGTEKHTAHLVARYFDTPERVLHNAGYSLRIRRAGRKRVQTLKADRPGAGLFARAEWEHATAADSPAIGPADGPLASLLHDEAAERLGPLFTTDVTRVGVRLEAPDFVIEVAIDSGAIRTDTRSEPVCELELELIHGSPAAVFDLARRINEEVPVRLAVCSKAERGYRLADGTDAQAFKAEATALAPEGSPAAALRAIAISCLRQFRLNEALVEVGDAPEPVHQARVALRRLRTALSLFRPLFGGDKSAELLSLEIRRLAMVLGETRNLDVLIPRARPADRPRLAAARDRAITRARAELASATNRRLMIDLVAWLTTTDSARDRDGNVVAFARAELDRCWRRLKRRRRRFRRGGAERHRVRIATKKLRYAADFFAVLPFGPKAARRHRKFLKRVEKVQDCLGHLNDLRVAPRILGNLSIRKRLPHGGRRTKARLIASAEDALDTLLRTRRFWRA